jgi:predicted HTH transcriptional regulator
MEQEILETIGGFLNSFKGGTLLIGVEDGGRIRGIEEDYATFTGVKRDRSRDERWLRDEYQRWLLQKVKSRIKSALPGLVAVDFEDVEGRPVCVVTVSPAPGEAWLHDKKSEPAFYVREGSMTIRLLGPDITGYSKTRWPS